MVTVLPFLDSARRDLCELRELLSENMRASMSGCQRYHSETGRSPCHRNVIGMSSSGQFAPRSSRPEREYLAKGRATGKARFNDRMRAGPRRRPLARSRRGSLALGIRCGVSGRIEGWPGTRNRDPWWPPAHLETVWCRSTDLICAARHVLARGEAEQGSPAERLCGG